MQNAALVHLIVYSSDPAALVHLIVYSSDPPP